jgi:hypothetical protein
MQSIVCQMKSSLLKRPPGLLRESVDVRSGLLRNIAASFYPVDSLGKAPALSIESRISQEFRMLTIRNAYSFCEILVKFFVNSSMPTSGPKKRYPMPCAFDLDVEILSKFLGAPQISISAWPPALITGSKIRGQK